MSSAAAAESVAVVRLADGWLASLRQLVERLGGRLQLVPDDQPIPGSYWGDDEAGLIDRTVLVRNDTPLHSALHEFCHWLLMDDQRRAGLHTDAGGDELEECAVCYLQLLLARDLGMCIETACQDMDRWGYSFRLGSATRWFDQDAEEARHWLVSRRLLDSSQAIQYGALQVPVRDG